MAGGQAAAALLRGAGITDAQIVRDGVKSEVDDDAGLSFGELMSCFCDRPVGRSQLLLKARDRIRRSRRRKNECRKPSRVVLVPGVRWIMAAGDQRHAVADSLLPDSREPCALGWLCYSIHDRWGMFERLSL